ncbi:MAG: T9SS type A sorting domain-containing protein, partial [Bacteroidota bacterium]
KTTTVTYTVNNGGQVELSVYNVLGERVISLLNKKMNAGLHTATADLTGLPEGNYYIQLSAEGKTEVRKLILEK